MAYVLPANDVFTLDLYPSSQPVCLDLLRKDTAPVLTAIAKSVGIELGANAMLISSFAATAMIQSYLVFLAFTFKPLIGIPILLLVFAGAWYYFEGVKKINVENMKEAPSN